MEKMRNHLLTAILFLTWIPAFAGMTVAAEKSIWVSDSAVEKNKYTIGRIEQYLTHLTTITADFTQVAPDGSLTNGKFFLQRPGKMRWQYNPPTPVLMVANGSELVFYDYELEQVSYIPLDGSLVSFLGREKITFGNDVGITKFSNEANAIRIEVAQRDKPTEGRLMLEFSDKPLTLRNMVVTDQAGQTTTVALQNASFGAKIDPALFVFKDPRKPRKR
jgi:outer membrane lipoprotein-sorting protein